MVGCAAFGCKNKQSSNISLHQFPWKDKKLLQIWVEKVNCYNRPYWQPSRSSILCSEHFEKNARNFKSEDLTRQRLGLPMQKRIYLQPGAIPTLFLNGGTSNHDLNKQKRHGHLKEKRNDHHQLAEDTIHEEAYSDLENAFPDKLVEDAAHIEAFGCTKNGKKNEIASCSFSKEFYLSTENVRKDEKDTEQIAMPSSLCSEHFPKNFKKFCAEYRRKLKEDSKRMLREHFPKTFKQFCEEYWQNPKEDLPPSPPIKPTTVTTILDNTEAQRLVPEIENQEIKLSSDVIATWGIIIPKAAFEDSLRMAMQSAMESFEINITVPNHSVETQMQPEMCSKEPPIKLTIVFNIQSEQETCQTEKSADFSTSADCTKFNFSNCVIKEEPKGILNDDETVNIACDELKDFSTEANNVNFSAGDCAIKQEYVLPEATFDENHSPLPFTLPERIPSPFESANTETYFKMEVIDSIEVSETSNDNLDISDSSFSEKAVLNSPCHIVPTDMSHANDNLLITKVESNLNFMKLKSELCN